MWIAIVLITVYQAEEYQCCNDGYYWQNNACEPCYRGCQSCTSWLICEHCMSGYGGSGCRCSAECVAGTCSVHDGRCTCNTGFYSNYTFYESNEYVHDCAKCVDTCTTCTSNTYCGECKEGFYGQTCGSSCSEHCVNGTCLQGAGLCKCVDGFYLINDDGYKCLPCPENCVTCSHSNRLNCDTCKKGFYGRNCTLFCSENCDNGECRKHDGRCTCLEGYYWNNQDCVKCPANCTTCTSWNSCGTCNAGFYGDCCQLSCSDGCEKGECDKYNGFCTCIDGYYYYFNQKHTCDRCPDRCSTCISPNRCTSCKPDFYGSFCQNQCKHHCKCETGYFGQSCEECSILCLDGCRQQDGECFSCVDGYYKKDGQCVKCSNTCTTCINGDTCETCKGGYYLSLEFHSCDPCRDNCMICNDTRSCITCKKEYANVNGICSLCCGTKCHETCVRCDKVADECTECKDDTFGQLCELKCSAHCLKLAGRNSSCWQHNGTCVDGCKEEYTGNNCTDAPEKAATSISSSVFTTVGATCGGVVLIAVLVITGIIVWRKFGKVLDVKYQRRETTETSHHCDLYETVNPVYEEIEINPSVTVNQPTTDTTDLSHMYDDVDRATCNNPSHTSNGRGNRASGDSENVYNVASYGQASGIECSSTIGEKYCHIFHNRVSKE